MEWLNLLKDVGFPIAFAAVLLWWANQRTQNMEANQRADSEFIREKMVVALENNAKTNQELVTAFQALTHELRGKPCLIHSHNQKEDAA